MSPYDLDRRVIDPVAVSELRVVGTQEIFIEVQPGVAALAETVRLDSANQPLQQFDWNCNFIARLLLGEDAERLGKKTVTTVESVRSSRCREVLFTVQPRQQKRVC